MRVKREYSSARLQVLRDADRLARTAEDLGELEALVMAKWPHARIDKPRDKRVWVVMPDGTPREVVCLDLTL